MKLSSREIALSGALAALSATAQLIHIGYQSPQWGMWIDVVAVSWIAAFFLFNIQSALLVSSAGALIITFFAPDTWLGASMKLIATIPIILSLYAWIIIGKKQLTYYSKLFHIVIPLIFGVIIRCIVVIPLNYYYAIPIWTGMNPQTAMKIIPWFIIAGFNVIQSLIDVILAWIIVYHFKLSRFAKKTVN